MGDDAVPELVGERIRLRASTDADVSTRAALGKSAEVVRSFGGTLDSDEPMSEDEAALHLAHRFGPGPHWVIADEVDRLIGVARLAPLDLDQRAANFAIGIFDPARLGQGLGTEATELVLRYGFADLGLHRISLTVLAENARAIASYEKCGFVIEGHLRHTLYRDGEWLDDLVMAILESEWSPSAIGQHPHR